MVWRPVVVGYQRLWACTSPGEAEHDLTLMRLCADRAGFNLGTTYAETAADYRGFEHALTAIERGEAHGLVVASENDLGDLARVRNFVRGMVAKSGGRLLIAEDVADRVDGIDLTVVADRAGGGLAVRSPDPSGAVMSGLWLRGLVPWMVPQARRAVWRS